MMSNEQYPNEAEEAAQSEHEAAAVNEELTEIEGRFYNSDGEEVENGQKTGRKIFSIDNVDSLSWALGKMRAAKAKIVVTESARSETVKQLAESIEDVPEVKAIRMQIDMYNQQADKIVKPCQKLLDFFTPIVENEGAAIARAELAKLNENKKEKYWVRTLNTLGGSISFTKGKVTAAITDMANAVKFARSVGKESAVKETVNVTDIRDDFEAKAKRLAELEEKAKNGDINAQADPFTDGEAAELDELRELLSGGILTIAQSPEKVDIKLGI